ncbi:hypothetical protein C7Y44_18475 [Paenibacillus popilliae]|uniref:Uncharacterized protein n=1 Tax=Paenibacillus popilliae TaxID=78057 RepID=A0ABY3AMS1_PAEPP|nr:hypothetical protein C7Y44_18475 [Paenibacillus sp. SDF0028]
MGRERLRRMAEERLGPHLLREMKARADQLQRLMALCR